MRLRIDPQWRLATFQTRGPLLPENGARVLDKNGKEVTPIYDTFVSALSAF